jgi:tRNA1Val (adenine37-N6)-methyltransferase
MAGLPRQTYDAGATCMTLTHDRLTRDITLWQRKKGHRFSSDDVVTAWAALQAAPHARSIADLGCGIGSVLLHMAWSLPQSACVGIEAQQVSFDLVQRNIADNGLNPRVRAVHGDLRDHSALAQLGGPFDLITGTPPYFPPSTALNAMDEQRAYARIEYRGGVEVYIAAAAPLLATNAPLVLCGDADAEHRVIAAATAARLAIVERCVVIPRAGQPPLFSVWTLRRSTDSAASLVERQLTLRDSDGERTDDAKMLRAFSGFDEISRIVQ